MYTSKKSIENHLCLIFDTFFIYYNTLFFIHDLEHIEFKIIRFFCRPQNRMIRCLCPVFYLSDPLMHILRCLVDRLRKKLIIHKMRAGTGCQISAWFYQLHSAHIDLTISLCRILDRLTGFGKCRWIQDYHIILLSFFFQLWKQVKYICTDKFNSIL